MTTTDRICAFLESKLPHSFWTFHGESIRAFVEKEVSLNTPISPRSETTEFSDTPPSSDTPAEHVWHDGNYPPNDTRYVMGEWADGVVVCWHGMMSEKWFECHGPHWDLPPTRWRELADLPPIRWRELTGAEMESIYD